MAPPHLAAATFLPSWPDRCHNLVSCRAPLRAFRREPPMQAPTRAAFLTRCSPGSALAVRRRCNLA